MERQESGRSERPARRDRDRSALERNSDDRERDRERDGDERVGFLQVDPDGVVRRGNESIREILENT